jgi:hypothetical protein
MIASFLALDKPQPPKSRLLALSVLFRNIAEVCRNGYEKRFASTRAAKKNAAISARRSVPFDLFDVNWKSAM